MDFFIAKSTRKTRQAARAGGYRDGEKQSCQTDEREKTEPDDPEDNPTDNPKDEPSDKPIESDVSKTGDSSNIALWAALVLISAYALNRLRAYARK